MVTNVTAGQSGFVVEPPYRVGGFAVPESLHLLRGLLERAAGDHPDVEGEVFMDFEIAVLEVAGNVVRHGRPPGEVRYSFALQIHDDRLVGLLADTGQEAPFDARDTPGMPDPTEESGRGLPMAIAVLDDLAYERRAGHNQWLMTRCRRHPRS